MKTRNVVLTMLAVIVASTFTFAGNPTSKIVVVNQNHSEIFKVIYEGTTVGRVILKVYDQQGRELLTETTKGLSKFMRPINFAGMEAGEYSIEITDANGTQTQKVNYTIATKSSKQLGRIFTVISRMPVLSSWNTPVVLPSQSSR